MPIQNQFPLHSLIIDSFKKDVSQGKAALDRMLSASAEKIKSQFTTAGLLQLAAHLLHRVSLDAANYVLNKLPGLKGSVLVDALVTVYLENADELSQFIDLLLSKKMFLRTSLQQVYKQLGVNYNYLYKDTLGEIYFLNKVLTLSTLSAADKINIHVNLAVAYVWRGNGSACGEQLNKAKHIEQTLSESKSNNKSVIDLTLAYCDITPNLDTADFKRNCTNLLCNLHDVYSSDKILKLYIIQHVNNLHKEPDAFLSTFSLCLIHLVNKIPELSKEVTLIESCIFSAPDSIISLANKAEYALALNRNDKAIAYQQGDDSTSASYNKALALYRQAKYKEAAKVFEGIEPAMLEKMPNHEEYTQNFHLQIMLGAYIYSANYIRIIRVTDHAIKYYPHFEFLYSRRITAYRNLREYRKAKEVTGQYIQKFPRSHNWKSQKLQLLNQELTHLNDDKADSSMVYSDVNYHIRMRQYDAARKKLAFFESLMAKTDRLSSTYMPDVHVQYAALNSYEGKSEEAIARLDQAESVMEHSYLADRYLLVYMQLKQYDKAENESRYILQQWDQEFQFGRQKRMKAIDNLAIIYRERGDLKQGIEVMMALLNTPGVSEHEKSLIHYQLAVSYSMMKDFRMAEKLASVALQLDEGVPDRLILSLLGSCYVTNGKIEEAIATFKASVKHYPFLASSFLDLGFCYYSSTSASQDKSVDHFVNAILIDPTKMSELCEKLPAEWIERVQEAVRNRQMTVSPKSEESEVSVEEQIREEPPVEATTIISGPSIPAAPYFSHEQLMHRMHQLNKKIEYERSGEEEAKEEGGWLVPGMGFIKLDDARLKKITLSGMSQSTTRLFAILNTAAIDAAEDKELVKECQAVISKGIIVGKRGQQGIRVLNQEETLTAEKKYHLPPEHDVKLKFFRKEYCNTRVFGERLASTPDPIYTLLSFDTVVFKSHK